jgi:SAM-dependent methyltransferase
MNGADPIWSDRVKQFGRRAVLNLGVSDDEIVAEIKREEGVVFPLLQRELIEPPRFLLDYGCGWGRFTVDLAALTGATDVIGYDPCAELVAMAQEGTAPGVRFVTGPPRSFFADFHAAFDLIWVHAVFGGIRDSDLPEVVSALAAILAAHGLLFLMEGTAPLNPANDFWHVREEQRYLDLLEEAGLSATAIGHLPTLFGEVKSIITARKTTSK